MSLSITSSTGGKRQSSPCNFLLSSSFSCSSLRILRSYASICKLFSKSRCTSSSLVIPLDCVTLFSEPLSEKQLEFKHSKTHCLINPFNPKQQFPVGNSEAETWRQLRSWDNRDLCPMQLHHYLYLCTNEQKQ